MADGWNWGGKRAGEPIKKQGKEMDRWMYGCMDRQMDERVDGELTNQQEIERRVEWMTRIR